MEDGREDVTKIVKIVKTTENIEHQQKHALSYIITWRMGKDSRHNQKKKTTTQENNKIARGEGRNNNKLIDKKQFSHKTH